MSFDPFGDFDTAGYLQNTLQLMEPEKVKRVEHLALKASIHNPIWPASKVYSWRMRMK